MPVSLDAFRKIAQSGGTQQVLLRSQTSGQESELKTRNKVSTWVHNLFRGQGVRSEQRLVAQSFVQALQDHLQLQNPASTHAKDTFKDYEATMQVMLGRVRQNLSNQLEGTRALTAEHIQMTWRFVSDMKQQFLDPLANEAAQSGAQVGSSATPTEAGLPETSADLLRVVQDRVSFLQQSLRDAGGNPRLEGVVDDLVELANQDIEPRQRLQAIHERLKDARLPSQHAFIPSSASTVLSLCLGKLLGLNHGIETHLAAPASHQEPVFLTKQEQTHALEDLHVREKAVVSWNLALRMASSVCRAHADSIGARNEEDLAQDNNFSKAYVQLSRLQDNLLDPTQRLDSKLFLTLEKSLKQALPDLLEWSSPQGAGGLSMEERAVFVSLQQVAKQVSLSMTMQSDPDPKTYQWLRESDVFTKRGTHLSVQAQEQLETQVLDDLKAALSAMRSHFKTHPQDAHMEQTLHEMSSMQMNADKRTSGLSAHARLRHLIEHGNAAAINMDRMIHLAATRGDVHLTSALLDLRSQLQLAQKAVYPGNFGLNDLEVSKSLRDEVGRAQLRQSELALQTVAELPVTSAPRVELLPEVPVQLKAQRPVALPSGVPQASVDLAKVLQVATMRLNDSMGLMGRKHQKELKAKYQDMFKQALGALTSNPQSEFAGNVGQQSTSAQRLQRSVAILEPMRIEIMRDISSRSTRPEMRRLLEEVLRSSMLASVVLNTENSAAPELS